MSACRILGAFSIVASVQRSESLIPNCNDNVGFGLFALDFTRNDIGPFYRNAGIFFQPLSDLFVEKCYRTGMKLCEEGPGTGYSVLRRRRFCRNTCG